MKKLFLTASLINVLTIAAFASSQKHNIISNNISLPHSTYAVTDLSKAENVTLSKSKKFLVKSFKDEGVNKTAFYNLQRELIATTYVANTEVLPKAGLKKLSKSYSDYTIQEVIVYEGNTPDTDILTSFGSENSNTMYFVHLTSEKESIILRINPAGSVYFFKKL
ncbi:MAG: hypothetical protein JWQ25_841 [Daejeonella sp.]|nr:hypothetical protein [Daejeonella sp.]